MGLPSAWTVAPGRSLELDRPVLMGVLNVTPDSFSDGGAWSTVDAAVQRGLEMAGEGAAIIDVGGESTRPGAGRVDAAGQIGRAVPVIAALRRRSAALISIDTTLASVAEAALVAGADIINDVSAGTEDPAMLRLAAGRGCGIVLMHRRLPPPREHFSDSYPSEPEYDDVVGEVRDWLLQRCAAAQAQGVARAAIAIDPGLGFGKSVSQNYQLIRAAGEFTATGYPVLSAASRKSFIGAATGEAAPQRRVSGSLAVSVMHWLAGVRLFRVHDVAAHREALAVAEAATMADRGVLSRSF